MPLNVHRVLTGSGDDNYLAVLTVPRTMEDYLRKARDEIRETIRRGLRN